MLGKLFKYEFKAMSRMMLPVFISFSVITVFAFIINDVFSDAYRYFDSGDDMMFMSSMIVIFVIPVYTLLLCAMVIYSFVSSGIRFSSAMFSNEGYLMRTLPVSGSVHILSRLAVGAVWAVISFCCAVIYLMIMFPILPQHKGYGAAARLSGALGFILGTDADTVVSRLIEMVVMFLYVQMLIIAAATISGKMRDNNRRGGTIAMAIIINLAVSILISALTALIAKISGSDYYTFYVEMNSTVTFFTRLAATVLFYVEGCRAINRNQDIA